MLQDFRAGIGKYGKWLVVLIAIPFAFFGVETIFFGGASVEEVASVDGERISRLELEQAVQRQRSYLLQRLGDIDPSVIDESLLRGPALENLVATQALANRARSQGMGVAPQLIAKVLSDASVFWVDGKFSQDSYLVYLRQMGYTPQTHNRFLGREILVSQLARGVTQTAFVTSQTLARAIALLEETRDFNYLKIPLQDMREEVQPSAEQIESYYRDHEQAFTTPEQVVLNYVELSQQRIAAQITVEEETLRERYQERVRAAEAASKRIVAQIFVRDREDGTDRAKLAQIEKELSEGRTFAEVAAAESEDPLTAEQGGEIGPYVAEDFPAPLRKAIEGLDVGEISAPVETAQGWHIVSVVREERPETGTFEEARESLRAEIAAEKARDQYVDQLAQLEELAYTSEDLAAVADRMGLELQVSNPLTRDGGEGLGAEPKVVDAAFSEPVLEDGYASSIIELDGDRALVIELREHRPPTLNPLDQVRPRIVEILESEQATALALERAAQLRARLDTGVSIAEVAAEADLDWNAHLDVGRYDQQFDRRLLEQVFAVPASRALPATGVLAQDDGVAVYQVKGIHPGSLDAVPVERRQELRRTLVGFRASQEFSAYQALLLSAADVEIAEGAIEAAP